MTEQTRVRRQIALLLREREFSYKEIGDRLGVSLPAVAGLLRPLRDPR